MQALLKNQTFWFAAVAIAVIVWYIASNYGYQAGGEDATGK